MKKETRVKDLPEVLRILIVNKCTTTFDVNWLAQPYLDQIDWQSVTDAERLAYCEVRYPIGTKCKALDHIKEEREFVVDMCPYFYRESSIAGKFLNGVLYHDGKFAEIISDEVKEPNYYFMVGDRPYWTPELIKQLPHGTVLECAMRPEDTFVYQGNDLIVSSKCIGFYEDNPIKIHKRYMWFTYGNKLAKIISLPETKSIKEKLKGTCVLNESVEMGAEIVALYAEAGIIYKIDISNQLNAYIGEFNGGLGWATFPDCFTQVLTLDQLREIVRGEKPIHEGEKQRYFIDDLVPNRNYIYHGNERDMVKGNTYFVYKANPDYIELLDAYGNPHQFIRSEWPLFELVKAESVEFKEGEIVDEYINGKVFQPVVYRFFAENKHWVSGGKTDSRVWNPDEIRKIDPDADLKNIADEVITEFYKENKFKLSEPLRKDVIQIAIEAMKKVQSKK